MNKLSKDRKFMSEMGPVNDPSGMPIVVTNYLVWRAEQQGGACEIRGRELQAMLDICHNVQMHITSMARSHPFPPVGPK